jgi:hypothetical protein
MGTQPQACVSSPSAVSTAESLPCPHRTLRWITLNYHGPTQSDLRGVNRSTSETDSVATSAAAAARIAAAAARSATAAT